MVQVRTGIKWRLYSRHRSSGHYSIPFGSHLCLSLFSVPVIGPEEESALSYTGDLEGKKVKT